MNGYWLNSRLNKAALDLERGIPVPTWSELVEEYEREQEANDDVPTD